MIITGIFYFGIILTAFIVGLWLFVWKEEGLSDVGFPLFMITLVFGLMIYLLLFGTVEVQRHDDFIHSVVTQTDGHTLFLVDGNVVINSPDYNTFVKYSGQTNADIIRVLHLNTYGSAASTSYELK